MPEFNPTAEIYRTITTPPHKFNIEMSLKFDALGARSTGDDCHFYYGNTVWSFYCIFSSDGLRIKVGDELTEVGIDIVKCNAGAETQIWLFKINKIHIATATVDVYVDSVFQGQFGCGNLSGVPAGYLFVGLFGTRTTQSVMHMDYIRIGTQK